MPVATPVTAPEVEFAESTPLPDTHVPPGVAEESVIVEPTHTVEPPVIAAGLGLTVASVVR